MGLRYGKLKIEKLILCLERFLLMVVPAVTKDQTFSFSLKIVLSY